MVKNEPDIEDAQAQAQRPASNCSKSASPHQTGEQTQNYQPVRRVLSLIIHAGTGRINHLELKILVIIQHRGLGASWRQPSSWKVRHLRHQGIFVGVMM